MRFYILLEYPFLIAESIVVAGITFIAAYLIQFWFDIISDKAQSSDTG